MMSRADPCDNGMGPGTVIVERRNSVAVRPSPRQLEVQPVRMKFCSLCDKSKSLDAIAIFFDFIRCFAMISCIPTLKNLIGCKRYDIECLMRE